MSGELTGYPRIAKDNVLELIGCVQDWSNNKNNSIHHLNNVASIKLDLISKKVINEDKDVEERSTYSDLLQVHSDKLCDTYEKMVALKDKMQAIANKFQGLSASFNLERSFREGEEEDLVFDNFTWDQYVSKVTSVAKMFSEEAKVKEEIVRTVCHVDSFPGDLDYDDCKNIITTMQSSWKYEPCVNEDELENSIRSMLIDLDLKCKTQLKDAYTLKYGY